MRITIRGAFFNAIKYYIWIWCIVFNGIECEIKSDYWLILRRWKALDLRLEVEL